MAHDAPPRRARQHHHRSPAAEMPRAEPAGERLGVHARQLALQSDLHLLRQHRRSLLRRLEQARPTALDHHVDRNARLGARVLIRESWYKLVPPVLHELLDRAAWIQEDTARGSAGFCQML